MMAARSKLEEVLKRFEEACRELLDGRVEWRGEGDVVPVCIAEYPAAIHQFYEYGGGVIEEGVEAVKAGAVPAVEVVARDEERGEEAGLTLTRGGVRAWIQAAEEQSYDWFELEPLGDSDVYSLVYTTPPVVERGSKKVMWRGFEGTAEGVVLGWLEAETDAEEGETRVYAKARSFATVKLDELTREGVKNAAWKATDLVYDLAYGTARKMLGRVKEKIEEMVKEAEKALFVE